MKYVALLRGVNVGGKNKLSMAELKVALEALGLTKVTTLLNSGNVMFEANNDAKKLARQIEASLLKTFTFDSDLIKILLVSERELKNVIEQAPKGFGSQSSRFHSDVVFIMEGTVKQLMAEVEVNPAVDKAWPGKGVAYYQRLSEQRTKSRLGKIIAKPIYKSLTIRSWNTVLRLRQKMEQL